MYKEQSLLELPLANCRKRLFLKDETVNPTGSLKDRVATHMLDEAERKNGLTVGRTIIDCTSGNNGIALAYEAKKRGYKFIAVVSKYAPPEKIEAMEALDAEVVLVDTYQYADPTSLMARLKQEALTISRGRPDILFLDQANNLDNAASYHELGRELGREVENINTFLGVIGTGGSLCGIGRGIKEQQRQAKVVAVCMEGSKVFSHKKMTLKNLWQLFRPIKDLPKNIDFPLIDAHRNTTYAVAINACKFLNERGISAGVLSSAVIFEALQLAHEEPSRPGSIVAILGDSAKHLESTILNDDWLKETNVLSPLLQTRLDMWTLLKE